MKYFLMKKSLHNMKSKTMVKSLEEENAKNLQLFEETNKKIIEENEKEKCSRRLIYFTIMLG